MQDGENISWNQELWCQKPPRSDKIRSGNDPFDLTTKDTEELSIHDMFVLENQLWCNCGEQTGDHYHH